MINPRIANPQISSVSQFANRKSANFQGKKAVFLIHIRIGLPLIFFYGSKISIFQTTNADVTIFIILILFTGEQHQVPARGQGG
jgi:hypothetical protein